MYDKFEKDLGTLKDKLENIDYANALYAALCNIIWVERKTNTECGYTWRASGGLIARLRGRDDECYLDFYCNGNEGKIRVDVLNDMTNLGWKPTTYDNKPIETYQIQQADAVESR